MKNYDKKLIEVVNAFALDYSTDELFEEIFGPEYDIGDIVKDMWYAGIIPDDQMEKFLND